MLLLFLMVFRVVWRGVNKTPAPLPDHGRWEVLSAHAVHLLLYALLFVAIISGYLITSADGSAIDVFGWFSVPSVTGQIKGLEDTAGVVHYWSTWALVALSAAHAAAAVKHHVVDRDNTLRRML
jgi:cytochrome b561